MQQRLTKQMRVALNRYALGGIDAMRTEAYTVNCKTIAALMRTGYLDKHGLTAKGRREADPRGELR